MEIEDWCTPPLPTKIILNEVIGTLTRLDESASRVMQQIQVAWPREATIPPNRPVSIREPKGLFTNQAASSTVQAGIVCKPGESS